jgi:hypothetical protein
VGIAGLQRKTDTQNAALAQRVIHLRGIRSERDEIMQRQYVRRYGRLVANPITKWISLAPIGNVESNDPMLHWRTYLY